MLTAQPELPYEPPFAMPDYRALGSTLLDLAHSNPVDDSMEHYYAADLVADHDALNAGGFTDAQAQRDILPLPTLGEYSCAQHVHFADI